MAQPKIEGTKHGQPRTFWGSDGEHWYAIRVDDDGRPHVVTEVSALPTGAATAANQATMITALETTVFPEGGLPSGATDKTAIGLAAVNDDSLLFALDYVPASGKKVYVSHVCGGIQDVVTSRLALIIGYGGAEGVAITTTRWRQYLYGGGAYSFFNPILIGTGDGSTRFKAILVNESGAQKWCCISIVAWEE